MLNLDTIGKKKKVSKQLSSNGKGTDLIISAQTNVMVSKIEQYGSGSLKIATFLNSILIGGILGHVLDLAVGVFVIANQLSEVLSSAICLLLAAKADIKAHQTQQHTELHWKKSILVRTLCIGTTPFCGFHSTTLKSQ